MGALQSSLQTTLHGMQKLILIVLLALHLSSYAQTTKTAWTGIASYYHPKFNGRKTSNGQVFNNEKLTAASNRLKIGTKVKVINVKNNKSVVVLINDHMHARNKRLIDVSSSAAKILGFYEQGICQVKIEVVQDSITIK